MNRGDGEHCDRIGLANLAHLDRAIDSRRICVSSYNRRRLMGTRCYGLDGGPCLRQMSSAVAAIPSHVPAINKRRQELALLWQKRHASRPSAAKLSAMEVRFGSGAELEAVRHLRRLCTQNRKSATDGGHVCSGPVADFGTARWRCLLKTRKRTCRLLLSAIRRKSRDSQLRATMLQSRMSVEH